MSRKHLNAHKRIKQDQARAAIIYLLGESALQALLASNEALEHPEENEWLDTPTNETFGDRLCWFAELIADDETAALLEKIVDETFRD